MVVQPKFSRQRRVGHLWRKAGVGTLNTSVSIPENVVEEMRKKELTPSDVIMIWYRGLDTIELGCPSCKTMAPRSAWIKWKGVCPHCKNVRAL